jgi:hypothetical protein
LGICERVKYTQKYQIHPKRRMPMPKRIIPLSDMKIQKAKSKDKNVTLFDGGGLFLMVTPTGGSYGVLNTDMTGNKSFLLLAHTRK